MRIKHILTVSETQMTLRHLSLQKCDFLVSIHEDIPSVILNYQCLHEHLLV